MIINTILKLSSFRPLAFKPTTKMDKGKFLGLKTIKMDLCFNFIYKEKALLSTG